MEIMTAALSQCCRAPQQVVRSMEGGFCKKLCTVCGAPTPLGSEEFFELLFPPIVCGCGRTMERALLGPYRNFGFACECGQTVRLAVLLPWWYEVYPLHVVGVRS